MKVDGLAAVADMQEYLREMEANLARDEQFGLVFFSGMSDEEYNSFTRESDNPPFLAGVRC